MILANIYPTLGDLCLLVEPMLSALDLFNIILQQVAPSKEQYLSNSFDIMQVWVKTFIGECHELMMNNTHKRNRDRGESKLKFQVCSVYLTI